MGQLTHLSDLEVNHAYRQRPWPSPSPMSSPTNLQETTQLPHPIPHPQPEILGHLSQAMEIMAAASWVSSPPCFEHPAESCSSERAEGVIHRKPTSSHQSPCSSGHPLKPWSAQWLLLRASGEYRVCSRLRPRGGK